MILVNYSRAVDQVQQDQILNIIDCNHEVRTRVIENSELFTNELMTNIETCKQVAVSVGAVKLTLIMLL